MPKRPNVRLARFILNKNVASRRYLYSLWNPKTLGGEDVYKRGNLVKKAGLKPGATAEDVAKYEAAVAANDGNRNVFFRSKANMGPGAEEVVFLTDSPVLAAYLRDEIREGRLKAREDVTAAPLQCAWCDFYLPTSTPIDQETMYRHHLDEHPDRLNDMVGESIPDPVVAVR